jgi:hypothetical protein
MRLRRLNFVRVPLAAVLLGLGLSTVPASAAPPPCPVAADALVAQALGEPVHGGIMTDFISDKPMDTGPDKTVCWWDTDSEATVTLSVQTNAYGPGGAATPAELAQSLFRVPDAARAEVDALRAAGVSDIQVPNYQLTGASGIGDAAVWVYQNDPTLNVPSGGFVVQHGADAYVFGVIGQVEADARPRATALAQAVMATIAP